MRVQDAGDSLVVVDFYKTSCGACKYILPGFVKLCKAAYGDDAAASVVFLKHNVFDDDEAEKTDLARRLQIMVRIQAAHFGLPVYYLMAFIPNKQS
jgi:thiol-disulfide isomerase/thioredoxin